MPENRQKSHDAPDFPASPRTPISPVPLQPCIARSIPGLAGLHHPPTPSSEEEGE